MTQRRCSLLSTRLQGLVADLEPSGEVLVGHVNLRRSVRPVRAGELPKIAQMDANYGSCARAKLAQPKRPCRAVN